MCCAFLICSVLISEGRERAEVGGTDRQMDRRQEIIVVDNQTEEVQAKY
jgi:hypothetical protein